MQYIHNQSISNIVNKAPINENVEVQSTYDTNDILYLDPLYLTSDSYNLQAISNTQVSINQPIQVHTKIKQD